LLRKQPRKRITYVGRRFAIRNLFFFLLLITALYFFFHSQIFNISRISVLGNHALTDEEVIDLSGVRKGTNIFKINLGDIKEKIKLHPMVEEVNAKRVFPDGLVIEIFEFKPYVLLPTEGGFIQVSSEGFYLKSIEHIGRTGLPIVTGVEIEKSAAPGDRIRAKGLDLALQILRPLNSNELRSIAELDVHDPSCINMFTPTGVKIILGSGEQASKKVRLALEIFSRLDREVEYIDVRFPKSPVIK